MERRQKQLDTWPLHSRRVPQTFARSWYAFFAWRPLCISWRAIFSFVFQLIFAKPFDCISKLQLQDARTNLQDARKNCRATFYRKAATFLIRRLCGVMFQSGTLLPSKRFNYWSGLCAGAIRNEGVSS
jgi:hypothetical protein